MFLRVGSGEGAGLTRFPSCDHSWPYAARGGDGDEMDANDVSDAKRAANESIAAAARRIWGDSVATIELPAEVRRAATVGGERATTIRQESQRTREDAARASEQA